jgi:hypothetical protein
MIFQHTVDAVLDGSKTQTRRCVDNDVWLSNFGCVYRIYNNMTLRPKWRVGKTYAVQPGRGKKAVGRIRITGIRKERLRDISEADAREEGCDGFWNPKNGFYNLRDFPYDTCIPKKPSEHFRVLWDSIQKKGRRWEDNPEVWVLEFELMDGGGDG